MSVLRSVIKPATRGCEVWTTDSPNEDEPAWWHGWWTASPTSQWWQTLSGEWHFLGYSLGTSTRVDKAYLSCPHPSEARPGPVGYFHENYATGKFEIHEHATLKLPLLDGGKGGPLFVKRDTGGKGKGPRGSVAGHGEARCQGGLPKVVGAPVEPKHAFQRPLPIGAPLPKGTFPIGARVHPASRAKPKQEPAAKRLRSRSGRPVGAKARPKPSAAPAPEPVPSPSVEHMSVAQPNSPTDSVVMQVLRAQSAVGDSQPSCPPSPATTVPARPPKAHGAAPRVPSFSTSSASSTSDASSNSDQSISEDEGDSPGGTIEPYSYGPNSGAHLPEGGLYR